MSQKTYYELLGVAKTATVDEIKSAFRQRAKACHPDRHAGSPAHEEEFKRLSVAHDVLKDPMKRASYDDSLRQRRIAPPSREPVRPRPVKPATRPSAAYTTPAAAAVVAPTSKRDIGFELLHIFMEALFAGLSTRGRKRSGRRPRSRRPRR